MQNTVVTLVTAILSRAANVEFAAAPMIRYGQLIWLRFRNIHAWKDLIVEAWSLTERDQSCGVQHEIEILAWCRGTRSRRPCLPFDR
jgi:hypothetical protein